MQYKRIIKDGLEGIADEQDNIIIPCIYKKIWLQHFKENGLFEVINKNNLSRIINIKNEIIIPLKYEEIVFDYKKTELIRVYNSAILTEHPKYSYYFIKNDKIILYNKKKIYAV